MPNGSIRLNAGVNQSICSSSPQRKSGWRERTQRQVTAGGKPTFAGDDDVWSLSGAELLAGSRRDREDRFRARSRLPWSTVKAANRGVNRPGSRREIQMRALSSAVGGLRMRSSLDHRTRRIHGQFVRVIAGGVYNRRAGFIQERRCSLLKQRLRHP